MRGFSARQGGCPQDHETGR